MKNCKIITIIFVLIALFDLPTAAGQNVLWVKYRRTPVEVSAFEFLNTSDSSLVRGAWYDRNNLYLILKLNETNYQYCNVSYEVWDGLKDYDKHQSYGRFYLTKIKGNYDCRMFGEPEYKD